MNKEESLALFAQGRDNWNAWAAKMSAEREALEAAGEWTAGKEGAEWNDVTRIWQAAAKADFTEHRFVESEDFSGFVFPARVMFSHARIAGDVMFGDATFLGDVTFSNAVFPGRAMFDGATFSDRAMFSHARIAGDAGFDEATFSGGAVFSGAMFSGYAVFSGATFSGYAEFSRATFSGGAMFREATFSGNVMFGETTFLAEASFDEATFSGVAEFSGATFSAAAQFTEAKLSGDARFSGATFSYYAMFTGATFSGGADFAEATFSDGAMFGAATFSGYAGFSEVTFSGDAMFSEATFSGGARFLQAVFGGFAQFADARFEEDADFRAIDSESAFSLAGAIFFSVPDFIQAHFSEAPRLDNSRIQPQRFEGPTLAKIKNYFTGDPNLSARWRALKRLAVQGHDHMHELEFFKNELKTRGWSTDHLLDAVFLFGLFYGWLSDFGRSIARPLFWWAASAFGFALLYMGAAAAPPLQCLAGSGDPWQAALWISARKALLFFGLDSSDKLTQHYACLYGVITQPPAPAGQLPAGVYLDVPDSVIALGIVQHIISAVLLFLLLLAIRNHFRIK